MVLSGIDREHMIQKLTRFEIQLVLDNPELFDDAVQFFIAGGYSVVPDDELVYSYNAYFGEDE